MIRIFSVISIIFILAGCGKSSEEKLFDVCSEKLQKELGTWAAYDGWNVENPKFILFKMVPSIGENEKYNTDQFWDFEVLISNFTVKNGFNADVKSASSCTGTVSKDSKGEYGPPMPILLDVTLNGKKLGL